MKIVVLFEDDDVATAAGRRELLRAAVERAPGGPDLPGLFAGEVFHGADGAVWVFDGERRGDVSPGPVVGTWHKERSA